VNKHIISVSLKRKNQICAVTVTLCKSAWNTSDKSPHTSPHHHQSHPFFFCYTLKTHHKSVGPTVFRGKFVQNLWASLQNSTADRG